MSADAMEQTTSVPILEEPIPPKLHWAWVLALSILTLGIFYYAWMIVQGNWARKYDRSNTTLLLYVAGVTILIVDLVFDINMDAGSLDAKLEPLIRIFAAILIVPAHFRLKDSIAEYSKKVGGPWLNPSGVLTFFFAPVYLQYQMNEVETFLRAAGLAK